MSDTDDANIPNTNTNKLDEDDVIYFGVGDNPASDIRGANAAGKNWKSILVRTGVFKSEEQSEGEDKADFICDNVENAIDLIIKY